MNKKNTVRWGLLSTANINRRLIPAIRAAKHGELVAIASRTQASADAYAKQWDIPQAFGSYQAMFDSGEIDAVYISLPNHMHAEWSIRAMEAGVHVLCEKPFALTLAEVDAMLVAQERTGMRLAEAFMYRHHPQTKTVGSFIQEGKLGDVTLVRGAFDFAFRTRENIRLVPEYGGGSLWDVGIYPMSFCQYIMGGAPTWVAGSQWVGDSGVDETFAALMHYPGGRMATISSAFRTPFHTFIEIIGTTGRMYITRPFTGVEESVITITPDEGAPYLLNTPVEELYLGEVRDMNEAILIGSPNYLTLEETRNHVKTLLALYHAANTQTTVHLSDL